MEYISLIPITIGFVLDLIIGDPHALSFMHPIRFIGLLISGLEKLVRRLFSKFLVLGGAVLAIIVLLLSTAVPLAVLIMCYRVHIALGLAVESVMCCSLFAAKSLRTESMKVYRAIKEDNTEGARKAVSMIVGRDTASLTREGIIKAAVETVAENTSDGVTAPIIYTALGGAPLGFFYKAANTMDSMIGYNNEKYGKIGRFAAKLDDVLNYIPSRLTALIMILSAGILGYDMKNAYRIWKRDRRNHASPNSAQTESVCAGALGVQLAGNAYYFGKLHEKPHIGDSLRLIENEDIRRANRLMYLTGFSTLLISLLIKFTVVAVVVYFTR